MLRILRRIVILSETIVAVVAHLFCCLRCKMIDTPATNNVITSEAIASTEIVSGPRRFPSGVYRERSHTPPRMVLRKMATSLIRLYQNAATVMFVSMMPFLLLMLSIP